MNTLTDRTVEAAARAHDDAKDTHARRKGELVAAVKNVAHGGAQLPTAISAALGRLNAAEAVLETARDRAAEARRAALTEDDKATSLYFQRVSALIAAHVVGLRLMKDPAEVHPWRVVEAGGRRRAVPQYANEFASIASAERLLDGPQQVRYGQYLAELFACDFHKIATANPYARACAILHAIGVDPDSEPPTLAQ